MQTITSLAPQSVAAGASTFPLIVTGTGFAQGAVVNWNGTALATTYTSATQLSAIVTSDLVAASGVGLVTVTQAGTTTSKAFSVAVANAIDLVTLAEVKASLGIPNDASSDDVTLQDLITGISQYWLTRTGRGSLKQVLSYTERYDGTGKDTLLLRQFPVVSASSVTIDGRPIPPSPDYIQPGWVINERASGLVIIGAGCYGNGYYAEYFAYGRMNVAVSYTAGYAELPYDIHSGTLRLVKQNWKRSSQQTIDVQSVALPQGGGTQRYRDWEVPPDVERVICAYRRWIPM